MTMYGFVAIICGGFVFGCLYDAAFTQEEQWQISKYIGAAFLLGVGWLLAVLFGGFGVLIDCAMAAVVILCNWNTIKANYHSPDAVKARAAWAQRYTTAGRWDATARDLGQRVSAFKASRAVVDEWVRQPEPVLQPEPKPEPRQRRTTGSLWCTKARRRRRLDRLIRGRSGPSWDSWRLCSSVW
jgi:hypothetical protein